MLLMAAGNVCRGAYFMVSRRSSWLWLVFILVAQHLATAQLTAAQAGPVGQSAGAAAPVPVAPAPLVYGPSPSAPAYVPAAPPPAAVPAPSTEVVVVSPPSSTPDSGSFVTVGRDPEQSLTQQRLDEFSKQLDGLSHLKFNGFIQAQYIRNATSKDGVDASGKPTNKDEFEVRRARFRATYNYSIAEFVLNIDAIPSAVTVKEAEGSVYIPWSDKVKTKVTAGLMYIPFGYEVQESDSVLPFVERSLVANRLFPGQRDIGIRVQGTLAEKAFEYQVAIMNGNPISDAVFPSVDPNGAKDLLGRIGTTLGGFRLGVSGLVGKGFLSPAVDDPKTTGVNESHGFRNFPHRAAAFDVSYKTPIPVIGELALYAEGTIARNLDRSTLGDYPKPLLVDQDGTKVSAGGVKGAEQVGGYVGFTQHFTDYVAIGARGEIFDPSTSKTHNTLGSLTLVGHVFPQELVRLTVAYQLNFENPKVSNNVFWLRAQVKF